MLTPHGQHRMTRSPSLVAQHLTVAYWELVRKRAPEQLLPAERPQTEAALHAFVQRVGFHPMLWLQWTGDVLPTPKYPLPAVRSQRPRGTPRGKRPNGLFIFHALRAGVWQAITYQHPLAADSRKPPAQAWLHPTWGLPAFRAATAREGAQLPVLQGPPMRNTT